MKVLIKICLVALAVAPALSACGGTSANVAPALRETRQAVANGAQTSIAYVGEVCYRKHAPCASSAGFVDVLGGSTITDGISTPEGVAFDKKGYVYVANQDPAKTSGFISVFAPGGTSPVRTIATPRGNPSSVAVDAAGNVYVVGHYKYKCCQILGFGAVFAPDGKLLRRLTGISGFPGKLTFDAAGDLYISSFEVPPGYVGEYKPGASHPFRVVQQGIGYPLSFALDAAGNLFVLTRQLNRHYDVAVYSPGTTVPARTIVHGLQAPTAVAVDAKGNLYVANAHDVGVYAPGSNAVTRTISTGIEYPVALSFDASGRLFVANSPYSGANSIAVYAPGRASPSRVYKLEQNVSSLGVP